MDIIKTIPENDVTAAIKAVLVANTKAMLAQGTAHVARCAVMQRLIDTAKGSGVSLKQALVDIDTAVKGFSLAKNEEPIPAKRDASGAFVLDKNGDILDPGTEWKLGYSMGRAYVNSADIAFAKGIPFSPSLYHNNKKELAAKKQADHASKLAQAETLAAEKAAEAKALATKAAKAKASEEVKLQAAQAKLDAEKAQAAVRKAIDAAPVSQKTGGRKATKVTPAKVLTRHEVALHATALVAMLESIGELSVASEVREILSDNNLLNM
jgi:hypothetical protein